jgi:hypothetical protein
MSAKKVSEQNGLADIIDLVAVLPIYPDVLDCQPTGIVTVFQRPQVSRERNTIFFYGGLQLALTGTARMEVRSASDEGQDVVIRDTLISKV